MAHNDTLTLRVSICDLGSLGLLEIMQREGSLLSSAFIIKYDRFTFLSV